MSEWVPVLAVFWVLWALDGVRLFRERTFTVAAHPWRTRIARVLFSRLSIPGVSPFSWRIIVPDVPLALSPAGIANRGVGSAGRPSVAPAVPPRALRWEEIREVGVARGWLFVNGTAFCPDSGHVTAPRLLQLARLGPAERATAITATLRRWFRPTHLRRRAAILRARSRTPAVLNVVALVGWGLLTLYLVSDVAAEIPASWGERMVEWLPWIILALVVLNVSAVVVAWRTKRRFPVRGLDKRGTAFLGGLLLPPQALRLRALLGEGYFPPQHPLAVVLAFASPSTREEFAFNVLADLIWPLPVEGETALGSEIAHWFRAQLETEMVRELRGAGIDRETLLAPPAPDSPASCRYCPRCRDQFVDQRQFCPNGVELRPLAEPGRRACR